VNTASAYCAPSATPTEDEPAWTGDPGTLGQELGRGPVKIVRADEIDTVPAKKCANFVRTDDPCKVTADAVREVACSTEAYPRRGRSGLTPRWGAGDDRRRAALHQPVGDDAGDRAGPGLRDRLPTRTTTPAVGGSGNNDMESPSKKLKHCLVS
jgi:hypothetical protein